MMIIIEANKFNYREKLGKAIRKKRRDADLTQGEIAKKTGLTTSTICKFETGNYSKDITFDNLHSICSLFGIRLRVDFGNID